MTRLGALVCGLTIVFSAITTVFGQQVISLGSHGDNLTAFTGISISKGSTFTLTKKSTGDCVKSCIPLVVEMSGDATDPVHAAIEVEGSGNHCLLSYDDKCIVKGDYMEIR